MILDNCRAPARQIACLKASLPTGTDGNGCEAATEGGGEGLPEGGDGPRGAGHGDWRPPVTWWLVICCQEATDRPARGLVYKSPHYHNGLLPHCISRLSHHKDYTAYCLCLLLQQPRRINVNVFLRPERSGQYLPSKFFLTRGDLCKSQRSRSWWRPLHHPSLLLRLLSVELLAGCGQVELENKADEVKWCLQLL